MFQLTSYAIGSSAPGARVYLSEKKEKKNALSLFVFFVTNIARDRLLSFALVCDWEKRADSFSTICNFLDQREETFFDRTTEHNCCFSVRINTIILWKVVLQI
jgi:hypothetical protein